MYAIVDVGGLQYKVSKSVIIRVPKMNVELGKAIKLDKVLLLVDKDKVQVGEPLIANVSVQAKVISHGKDKKVMVLKKKRRKNYRVLRGHRQEFTEIQIDQISAGKSETAKPVKRSETAKTEKKVPAASKTATKAPKKPAIQTKPKAKKALATKIASAKAKPVKKPAASKVKKEK